MTTDRVEELVKELRMVANMINMGEKIQWARETTLMDEAADRLEALTQDRQDLMSEVVTEDTSDGYHTFKEMYEFRKTYNAVLFNEWFDQGKYQVHKSHKHSDGENCFGGGWFIVVATLPTGDISNHYEQKDWDLFKCEVREKAKEWDGHTAQDVVKRLKALTEARTIIKSK